MVSTYLSYLQIARDMPRSIQTVSSQPMVERETAYYLENIGKVTSVEDFLGNDRLYRYAMKAHGLEEMSYAKAFMRKALEGGVTDPDSFANKLTDKRYAEFVKSFNFVALGSEATTYNSAQSGTIKKYAVQAQINGVSPEHPQVQADTAYYLENIVKVRSIDDLFANQRLYDYAMRAFGLDPIAEDEDFMRELLEGGVRDPDSLANQQEDTRYKAFAASFDFEQWGASATTRIAAQGPATEKYFRQTLEENAGAQNEGVRLALYFERKAASIDSFYAILADPALAEVLRTALGLPDAFAQADVDKQVALFAKQFDIEDFQDPEKLSEFLTRFTSQWEIKNPSSPAQSSMVALFGQAEFGISTDLLLTMARLKG